MMATSFVNCKIPYNVRVGNYDENLIQGLRDVPAVRIKDHRSEDGHFALSPISPECQVILL